MDRGRTSGARDDFAGAADEDVGRPNDGQRRAIVGHDRREPNEPEETEIHRVPQHEVQAARTKDAPRLRATSFIIR